MKKKNNLNVSSYIVYGSSWTSTPHPWYQGSIEQLMNNEDFCRVLKRYQFKKQLKALLSENEQD